MEFNSTGGMRSPFSPRVRQSISGRRPIGMGSAKKNQSKFVQSSEQQTGEVVYKTPFTTLETYGTPLPVMVTETLTFAPGEVTVRLSSCGWCWAVCGRRVLAWPWDPALPGGAARDLTLPQTDLAHKADLVVLFYEEDAQMPSCVGVSPEGVVRYWASVGAEGASCDVSCELAGQECDRLIPSRGGLLLATTTCTLLRITTAREGRPSVSCRTVRPPSGWLGGLGRRVSLLFFGSMPAHHDTKLVNVVVLRSASAASEERSAGSECVALVAGGPVLQLWEHGGLRELALRRHLWDALARTHLAPHGEASGVEMTTLDAQPHPAGGLLLLLLLAPAAPRAPDHRYALAHVSVEDQERVRVLSVCGGRGAGGAPGGARCLPLQAAVVYTDGAVIRLAPAGKEQADAVELSPEGDGVLGAAALGGRGVVFSRRHGPLLLTTDDPALLRGDESPCDSPTGSPCPSDMYDGNLSLYEIDPDEVVSMCPDAMGKLKSAFLYHVRGQRAAAAALLSALGAPSGPPGAPPGATPDRALHRTVLAVATEMVDDAPAGDPRWKAPPGAATRVSLGGSCSLQAAAQLQDKRRVYDMFMDFLRAHGLWRRLGALADRAADSAEDGAAEASAQAELVALGERLAAARALQRLQRAGAPLVEAALQRAPAAGLEDDPAVLDALRAGTLSAADVCWRRVSRAPLLLAALCRLPPPPHDARAAAQHAHDALVAVNAALSAMQAHRSSCSPPPARARPSLAPRALLPALCSLHTRAVTECARKCPDPSLRAQLLEEASSLARSLLLEAEPLAEGSTAHLYEKMRTDTIQPYVAEGQAERAAVLAEKFKDFELLIRMCVERDDTERLYGYIDKYEDEGFPEKTFAWLCSRGGAPSALLVRSVGARAPGRLGAWLDAAPDRLQLSALHALARGDTARAAELCARLADEEDEYVNRMATAASLSKLCSLASDEPGDADSSLVSRAFSVVRQHRALPAALRRRHALDEHEPRLFTAEELVQMYIESEHRSLTEYDYKKALDLTELVADGERREELRLQVWCACIRRDDWARGRADAPELEMKDKTFFRLLDLVHLMGGELQWLLPPLTELLARPELAACASSPRALYLLKYGYQCVAERRPL